MIKYGFLLGLSLLMMFAVQTASAASENDPITGLWYTENHEGGVELYHCADRICGRLHWLMDDEKSGEVSLDRHNADALKRDRPLCGMEFMTGFTPDGKGHYTDGTIYSPRHGANFSADMTLKDENTLDLHGYMLFSFLGESQVWTRGPAMPACVTGLPKSPG